MLKQVNDARTGAGFPVNTPFEDKWDALSKRALTPAFAQNRIWLTAQSDNLSTTNNREIIFSDRNEPISVAGLTPRAAFPLVPIKTAVTWDTGFLFSGTPLLDSKNPEQALIKLLQKAQIRLKTKSVLFYKVQQSDIFDQTVSALTSQQSARHKIFKEHQRAVLNCTTDYETWFNENFSRKRKKEYRRLRNRLADQGDLVSTTWDNSMPIGPWLDEFLALEKSGWKGKGGTAIACNDTQEGHLRQAVEQMAQNGSLLFWKITLDDKVIASMFGFTENNQAWLGKMAFDETKSQFSPGVLVILDATKDFLDNPLNRSKVELVDSSADANHPMINNIWRDRITIADYLIATPNTSDTMFKVVVALETFRQTAREFAKKSYHQLKARLKKNGHH